MIVGAICFLSILLLKLVFYAVLLFVALVIGLKLWFEPIKGVCKCQSKLNGRVALVTGGNSGIGLETARDLAKRGARVIIASRDAKKAEAAILDIINSTRNPKVEFKYLDLSSFDSVRRFAKEFNETEDRLDILVNNAGCAGLRKRLTKDGIDIVMQINYLGPFLLTNLLLDKLKASRPSRIVIVSSTAHHFAKLDARDLAGINSKGHFTIYANSKLCNVLWAKALAKRLPRGVTANVLHPGVVKTEIFNRLPKFRRSFILKVISLLFKSAKEGAQTTIHLCVAPELEDATGGYYKDCKPESVSGKVTDQLVDKVWEESFLLVDK